MSNEGIVMSEREAFEKLQKYIPPWIVFDEAKGSYKLAEQALNSEDNHEILNSYNREWWIFQSALEHCKQGDPVAWQFFQDGQWHTGGNDQHKRNTIEYGFEVRDLFAHAMLKSDPQPTTDISELVMELDSYLKGTLATPCNVSRRIKLRKLLDEVIAKHTVKA